VTSPLAHVGRYARLLALQVKSSTLLSLQYRADFVLDGAIEVFWAGTAIVPLFVVYGVRRTVAGWTFGEALLVVGWFTLLQGVLEGAINPSLTSVVEHVRKGTLDFVLIKPADAQFLVSTARFQPWRAVNVVTALILFVYAFHRIGRAPAPLDVFLALVMLAASVVVLYALWILTVSAVFYVVRIDNLTHLFTSIFDAARWPSSVFRGVLRWFFTFVIPLALMTTYPAEALLGTLSGRTLAFSLAGALAFAWGSRRVWQRSIGHYTSAA
jgi:ABC-2 type transport system permease protein